MVGSLFLDERLCCEHSSVSRVVSQKSHEIIGWGSSHACCPVLPLSSITGAGAENQTFTPASILPSRFEEICSLFTSSPNRVQGLDSYIEASLAGDFLPPVEPTPSASSSSLKQ